MTRLLRKREAADRLGVNPRTLERWEKAGQFPARVRVGANTTGWLESDLEAWLLERERVSVKAPARAPLPRGAEPPAAAEGAAR